MECPILKPCGTFKTKQDYSRGVRLLVLVVVPENMKSISAGEASMCCPVYFRENTDDFMAKTLDSFQLCNVNELIVTNYQKRPCSFQIKVEHTLDRPSVILCCVKASSDKVGVTTAEK